MVPTEVRSAITGVSEGCELLYGCWEQNSSPSEVWPLRLTTEPSLQPHPYKFVCVFVHLFEDLEIQLLITALGRQRLADLCEFEASLIRIVSSG